MILLRLLSMKRREILIHSSNRMLGSTYIRGQTRTARGFFFLSRRNAIEIGRRGNPPLNHFHVGDIMHHCSVQDKTVLEYVHRRSLLFYPECNIGRSPRWNKSFSLSHELPVSLPQCVIDANISLNSQFYCLECHNLMAALQSKPLRSMSPISHMLSKMALPVFRTSISRFPPEAGRS